jgi:CBS domain-containing protein
MADASNRATSDLQLEPTIGCTMMSTERGDRNLLGGQLLVADAMSPDPLLLRGDMRLEQAIELLVDRGYSGAPVMSEHAHLIGMLHAIDVAVMHLIPMGADSSPPPTTLHALIREVCRDPVTVEPTNTVETAATLMRTHHTDRLAVVDGPDHVVGVLTDHDLLRTLSQRGDLLREIVDAQITELGLPDVRAAVDFSGVVLLTGTVASAADRDRAVRALGALDGVTEVDELLSVAEPGR